MAAKALQGPGDRVAREFPLFAFLFFFFICAIALKEHDFNRAINPPNFGTGFGR
jgi:hypothetical protein